MSLCSSSSRTAGEPLAATATRAQFWVAVEQPGPWGRNALTESGLDERIGAELERRVAAPGGRAVVIRSPGGHATPTVHPAGPGRQVFVGYSNGERTWLRSGQLSVEQLIEVDWAAVATGNPVPVVALSSPSRADDASSACLLVCTNGRRDTCCAVLGRPMALALADAHPGRVWECSHLGGHRFAPSMLVLPTLAVYGRLGVAQAEDVLTAAAGGRIYPEGLRGRTFLAPAEQAAESAVRAVLPPPADLTLRTRLQADGVVRVSASDGRGWEVAVQEEESRTSRPESCGAAELPIRSWRAAVVRHIE